MNTTAEDARAGDDQHGRHHEGHGHHHCPTVTIIVDNKEVFLHAGDYPLATIKKLSGVPLADDLDELVDCTLKPVPDDATVKVHGCEIFVSHVKAGGSS